MSLSPVSSPALLPDPSTTGSLPVTLQDHGTYVDIAAALGVSWTLLVLGVRLYIRLRLIGPFGADDATACLATLAGLCQSAVMLVGVRHGVGRRQNLLLRDETDVAMMFDYAANLLYIATVSCSKCSMALLMARLSSFTGHRIAAYALCGFAAAWGVASLFVIGFQCSFPQPWDVLDPASCSSVFARWVAVEAVGMLIAVLGTMLAVSLVKKLSMAFKTKVIVVSAFSAQLLVLVPIGFRLGSIRRLPTAYDVTFDMTSAAITTLVAGHLTVMAASFPCFRQLLRAFDGGLGMSRKLSPKLGSSGSRSQRSHALQSLGGDDGDARARGGRSRGSSTKFRTGVITQVVSQATAGPAGPAGGDESGSVSSFGSDKAIIWRTHEVEVHYEPRDQ
ncbi:hypothetical protein CDD83_320 [Cordyceps sp. RAO-2017]|nr:hypothetical protein CDD83_320 [Cordyceps sp. RAO-2017]